MCGQGGVNRGCVDKRGPWTGQRVWTRVYGRGSVNGGLDREDCGMSWTRGC